jgi:hypothetical protein
MNTAPHEDGDDVRTFEARLRGYLPGALPDGFVAGLAARVVARRPWLSVRFGWVAAAALLTVGLWLGFGETKPLGDGEVMQTPKRVLGAPMTEVVNAAVNTADDGLVEVTDVVGAEDAGTAPSEEGLYRIVRVMLVHRTVERGVEADAERVISEQTSEQYVAVPLEIF